eukprot:scaffold160124_cov50-Attheya_sp.AAC.1
MMARVRAFLFLASGGLLFSQSCFAFVPLLQRAALKAQLRKACKSKDTTSIFKLADELQKVNPTTNIIKDFSKLGGDWKLDFTTAPIGEVPDTDSTTKTFQSIDTDIGIIYNVIDRGLPQKGLKIGVGAEPTRPNRVALDFRTIEAYNDKFPKKLGAISTTIIPLKVPTAEDNFTRVVLTDNTLAEKD